MKTYNIFPTIIGSFDNDDDQINEIIIQKLEVEPFIENGSSKFSEKIRSYQTNHYLHKSNNYAPIINFIKSSLNEYKNNLELDCDALDISICWANKYPRYTSSHQPLHAHRMSYVSGVYYLTKGAPTYFQDPVSLRFDNSLHVTSNIPTTNYFSATPGNLLIFPSWLKHGTAPHEELFDRWTISFNAIPSGKINSNSNGSKNPSCVLQVL